MFIQNCGVVPGRSVEVQEHRDGWVAVAEGLLEYETLTGDEIRAIMRGEKPVRNTGDDAPPSRGSAVPKTGARKEDKKGGEEPEAGLEPQPQG